MSNNPFLDMAGIDPAAAPQPVAQPPLAVRNHNPGNLRWDGQSHWQGMTGVDPNGFIQFDTPESGARALGINLANQPRLHGLDTVRGIITKFAPPSDGNDTGAYISKVAQTLGVGADDKIDPADPRINQVLQSAIVPVEAGGGMPAGAPQPSPAQPARNPFLEMANGGNAAGHDGAPSPRSDFGPQGGGPGVYSDGGGGGSGGADPRLAQSADGQPSDWQQLKDWGSGVGHWAAGLDPLSNKLVNGVPIKDSLQDNWAGLASGVASVPETLMDASAWVVDHTGAPKSAQILRRWSKGLEDGTASLAANPDSTMFKSRELLGMIGATAPVAEIAPLSAAARSARAGKLASGIARYGDMALQGAAAGGLTSRGEDVGEKMAAGAVLAPALGVAVDRGLPVVLKAGEKVGNSKIAQALRARMASGGADAAAPGASADAGMLAQGWKPDEIAQGWRKGPDGQTEFTPAPIIRKGSELNSPAASHADVPQGASDVQVDGAGNVISYRDPSGELTVVINGAAGRAPAAAPIEGDKPPIDPKTLAAAVRAAGNQGGEMTPAVYVDAYLAGKGRGTSAEDLSLQQYAANNAKAIEQEFSQRATAATKAGPGDSAPVKPQRAATSLDDARAAAGQFVGRPVTNEATGVQATISNNTLAKMTNVKAAGSSNSVSDHALAVANADHLFETAQQIARYPDPRGEPTLNISRWRSYMDTPNGVRGVKMTVKETAHPSNPNPLYTIETMEVEPGLSSPKGDVEGEPAQARYSLGQGSDASIAQAGDGANDIERLRAALGSRGARRGIESDINWPADVQAHAQRLVADGMPLDQALREAEITYIGAQPTLAHVTRNPADQRAMWEGAKQDSVEGQLLATQIANNNNAIHSTLQGDIGKLGGAPAEGEATEAAARSLARTADHGREEVSKLYHAAEQAGGTVRVIPEELIHVVNTPRYKAAVTDEGRNFIRGMNSRLMTLTRNGKRGLTASELDQLHQHASYAFDPSTSQEVNKLIWEAKDAINHHLDKIGEAGPAYAKARAAHRAWAEKYENPEGVRNLIRRNVEGVFKHEDNWRRADGLIKTLADRPFIQVVKQLKANGDARSIDRLKASVVQSAYEYATGARGGNAVDQLGNSPVSGKLFLAKLDAIGMPKLQALFSPDELGRLATIGRAAAHLNEAVPGTVNTSGTTSTLLNALRAVNAPEKHSAVAKIGKAAAHLALAPLTHGAGNVALEGLSHAAGATKAASARAELAEQLRLMMDPAASRAADRAEAQRVADALRRRATARTISSRTPPIVGSAQQQQRRK